MEVENKSQQTIDDLYQKSKNADHEAQVALLAKITNEIKQLIREENGKSDTTDSAFDVLSEVAESLQEDFEELIEADSNKKIFMKVLSKIIELLLNANVNTIDKSKRTLKIAIEITLKLWQGARLLLEDFQQSSDAAAA